MEYTTVLCDFHGVNRKENEKKVADSKVIANVFTKTTYSNFICCLVWLFSLQEKIDLILHTNIAPISAE